MLFTCQELQAKTYESTVAICGKRKYIVAPKLLIVFTNFSPDAADALLPG